ncbi:MAG TPA: GTP cyclohydrolase II [Flavilitoribacter sp.]|nr:GTP cyclohydrolase II [Lewinella sp.]MCB9279704.1 GTP cyclohydrolase II [Lewinellaceae bacterium]HMQ60761.1 GTP cyclohydrolase II [Flavilitoribacter sp.]HMQ89145.1 GTP cyclohydrolase II [Flavilitoribacter sp.]
MTDQNGIIRQAEAPIPTSWGDFQMIAFAPSADDWMPHLALVSKGYDPEQPALVRIHSECITGDLFGSRRCDCGEQLSKSLSLISSNSGILLYLRQEGRGIGLINKLKAYELQDMGLNTIEANIHLGQAIDARHYDIAVEMLRELGVKQIHLLTNNPDKVQAFEESDVKVLSRIPLIIEPGDANIDYLRTKQREMGHMLNVK